MDKMDIIKGKRLLEKNYGRYRVFLTGANTPALTLCRVDTDADGQETITAVLSYDMSDIYLQTFNYFEKPVATDLLDKLIDKADSFEMA